MDRFDVHQHITNQIVTMMEEATGDYRCPWLRSAKDGRPLNVASGKPYRGVNVLALWAAASIGGYTAGVWGTYRQWNVLGAQVRKGAKAAYIVFWKELTSSPTSEEAPRTDEDRSAGSRLVARASAVFAAEQVDGYKPPAAPEHEPARAVIQADAVIIATGAKIIHEGERAYYQPATDTVHIPAVEQFIGTPTLSPTKAYYATLLHELVHWTGHPTRCDRNLNGRFGQEAYAMEELIAELGAAFLCADLQSRLSRA